MVGMIEGETKKIFTGLKCVQDFVRYLENNYKGESLILYAHNCMYDFSFLVDYVLMHKDGVLIKDGSFYRALCRTYKNNVQLEFRDSLKMLNMPLAKVPDFLGLKIDKEAYDYSLNNIDVFFQGTVSYDLIKDIELRNRIKENCIKLRFEDDSNPSEFDIVKYC